MIQQILWDELRLSFPDPLNDGSRSGGPLPPRTTPDGHLGGRRLYAPLAAVRLVLAAIRLWRSSARSRRELRKLSDQQLTDIGLRRETAGYDFPKALLYRD